MNHNPRSCRQIKEYYWEDYSKAETGKDETSPNFKGTGKFSIYAYVKENVPVVKMHESQGRIKEGATVANKYKSITITSPALGETNHCFLRGTTIFLRKQHRVSATQVRSEATTKEKKKCGIVDLLKMKSAESENWCSRCSSITTIFKRQSPDNSDSENSVKQFPTHEDSGSSSSSLITMYTKRSYPSSDTDMSGQQFPAHEDSGNSSRSLITLYTKRSYPSSDTETFRQQFPTHEDSGNSSRSLITLYTKRSYPSSDTETSRQQFPAHEDSGSSKYSLMTLFRRE